MFVSEAIGTVGQSSGSVYSRSPLLNQSRSSFSSVAASPSRFSPSPRALLPSSYGTTKSLFPLASPIPGISICVLASQIPFCLNSSFSYFLHLREKNKINKKRICTSIDFICEVNFGNSLGG